MSFELFAPPAVGRLSVSRKGRGRILYTVVLGQWQLLTRVSEDTEALLENTAEQSKNEFNINIVVTFQVDTIIQCCHLFLQMHET